MTFSEFVRGVMSLYGADTFRIEPYWSPQVTNCGLCQLNYSFIGNVRTFQDDIRYLLQRLKFKENLEVVHHDKTDTFDVLKQFTGIDLQIRRQLLKVYKIDYDAFKFPLPGYLGLWFFGFSKFLKNNTTIYKLWLKYLQLTYFTANINKYSI